MGRPHTLRQKERAVALAEARNSSEVAGKELGIPARTIRRWREDPAMADVVRKTREETAEDVTAAMVLAWGRIIERLQRDEVDTKELIILAGVATDKAQLLAGKATSRTETRDLFDQYDDHETELLGDAIRDELARRADARPAESAVEGAPAEGADTPTG